MKKLAFGCSTWFLQEYSVTDALEIISRHGFQAAEIWMEHLWKNPEPVGRIRERAGRLNLSVTLHAASYDLNIASTNSGIRRESRHQVDESLDMAAEIGAKPVVVHAGRLSSTRGDVDEYWSLMEEAFEHLDRAAAVSGTKVAVEAMEKRAKERFVTPADIDRLMSKDWRNLGITVDLAHVQSFMDHEQFFSRINGEWVFHAHLSDYSSEATHKPLGRGSMNIDRALQSLQTCYQGLVILEGTVQGAGPQTIEGNRNFLHDHGWM